VELNSDPIKISPSGLYGFTECKTCFWIGYHIGAVSTPPYVLNMAMDSILKSRFDHYRAQKRFPPEAEELTKDGVQPFIDMEKLAAWRGSAKHLQVASENDGYVLRGKIDDVFVESDGRLIPADYKSSGYAPKSDKQKYYRYQLAAYGFMFENAGFPVSDRAYLMHYYVADAKNPAIDIAFSGQIDRVEIAEIDIDTMLRDIVAFVRRPFPGLNPDCEDCAFYRQMTSLVNSQ
jgi:hypothetical protein